MALNVLDLGRQLAERSRGSLLEPRTTPHLAGPTRPLVPIGQEARFANLLEWRVVLSPSWVKEGEIVAIILATPDGTIAEWSAPPGVGAEAAHLAILLGAPTDDD